MIYTALDNFYLTDESLANPPSCADGVIDLDTEFKLRVYAAELIQEAGLLLKVPQAVMATGQVLMHRFYCKKSMTRYPVKRVAAACVWLATKLEENPRKLRDVLNVFLRMECRRENLPLEFIDYFSKRYEHLKSDVIKQERLLLREFGFIVHVEHPHKFVLNYLQMMGMQHLMQEAWSLVNDSLRSPLCVRFNAEVVACRVIFLAARRKEVSLPEEPPWYTLFGVERSDMEEVCRMICGLYSLPKATYTHVVPTERLSLAQCCFVDPNKGKPPQDKAKSNAVERLKDQGSAAVQESPLGAKSNATGGENGADNGSPAISTGGTKQPTPQESGLGKASRSSSVVSGSLQNTPLSDKEEKSDRKESRVERSRKDRDVSPDKSRRDRAATPDNTQSKGASEGGGSVRVASDQAGGEPVRAQIRLQNWREREERRERGESSRDKAPSSRRSRSRSRERFRDREHERKKDRDRDPSRRDRDRERNRDSKHGSGKRDRDRDYRR